MVWCKEDVKFLIDNLGFPQYTFSGTEGQGQPPRTN